MSVAVRVTVAGIGSAQVAARIERVRARAEAGAPGRPGSRAGDAAVRGGGEAGRVEDGTAAGGRRIRPRDEAARQR